MGAFRLSGRRKIPCGKILKIKNILAFVVYYLVYGGNLLATVTPRLVIQPVYLIQRPVVIVRYKCRFLVQFVSGIKFYSP